MGSKKIEVFSRFATMNRACAQAHGASQRLSAGQRRAGGQPERQPGCRAGKRLRAPGTACCAGVHGTGSAADGSAAVGCCCPRVSPHARMPDAVRRRVVFVRGSLFPRGTQRDAASGGHGGAHIARGGGEQARLAASPPPAAATPHLRARSRGPAWLCPPALSHTTPTTERLAEGCSPSEQNIIDIPICSPS